MLQLDVSRRNPFGVSLARRTPSLPPQLSATSLARFAASQFEISSARIFCLGGSKYVRERDCGIHAEPLWSDRRRPDAEFLSLSRRDRRNRARDPRAGIGLCAEFLVSLSLPLRSAAGYRFPKQSAAHPALGNGMHRLHEVCQGLPLCPARR